MKSYNLFIHTHIFLLLSTIGFCGASVFAGMTGSFYMPISMQSFLEEEDERRTAQKQLEVIDHRIERARWNDARQMIDAHLDASPYNSGLLRRAALLHAATGGVQQARESLQLLSSRHLMRTQDYLFSGWLCLQAGENESACFNFQKALEGDEGDKPVVSLSLLFVCSDQIQKKRILRDMGTLRIGELPVYLRVLYRGLNHFLNYATLEQVHEVLVPLYGGGEAGAVLRRMLPSIISISAYEPGEIDSVETLDEVRLQTRLRSAMVMLQDLQMDMAADRWGTCVETLCRLIESGFSHPSVFRMLVFALQEDGREKDAFALAEKLVEHWPEVGRIRAAYAMQLFQSGNIKKALSQIDQAYALAYDEPEVTSLYGVMKLQQGEYYEASMLLENALNAAPDSPQVMFNLICAYAARGQDDLLEPVLFTLVEYHESQLFAWLMQDKPEVYALLDSPPVKEFLETRKEKYKSYSIREEVQRNRRDIMYQEKLNNRGLNSLDGLVR